MCVCVCCEIRGVSVVTPVARAHALCVMFVGFSDNNTMFCLLISLNKCGRRKLYTAHVKSVC